jgi:hypothetical protein
LELTHQIRRTASRDPVGRHRADRGFAGREALEAWHREEKRIAREGARGKHAEPGS